MKMLRASRGFIQKAAALTRKGIPMEDCEVQMPPFTPKEVARYLAWVGIIGAAVGALLWMLFFATGRQRIQMPGSSTPAVLVATRPGGAPFFSLLFAHVL
jgi:hypothetical protein